MSNENLPDLPDDVELPKGGVVNIENFNHSTNDLDALRRLAEVDPELAKEVVRNKDNANRRETNSFTMAVFASVALVAFMICAGALVLINLGALETAIFVAIMLGCSHVVRVILTGKWSSTSWIGSLLQRSKSTNDND